MNRSSLNIKDQPGSVPLPKPRPRVMSIHAAPSPLRRPPLRSLGRLNVTPVKEKLKDSMEEDARDSSVYLEELDILHRSSAPPLSVARATQSPSLSKSAVSGVKTKPLPIPPVPPNNPHIADPLTQSSPFLSSHPCFNSSSWSERGSEIDSPGLTSRSANLKRGGGSVGLERHEAESTSSDSSADDGLTCLVDNSFSSFMRSIPSPP